MLTPCGKGKIRLGLMRPERKIKDKLEKRAKKRRKSGKTKVG